MRVRSLMAVCEEERQAAIAAQDAEMVAKEEGS